MDRPERGVKEGGEGRKNVRNIGMTKSTVMKEENARTRLKEAKEGRKNLKEEGEGRKGERR